MDAEAIDLPDASVDAVICRLGLMFLPDLHSALAGVARVLRAGRTVRRRRSRGDPRMNQCPRSSMRSSTRSGWHPCHRPRRVVPGSSASPTYSYVCTALHGRAGRDRHPALHPRVRLPLPGGVARFPARAQRTAAPAPGRRTRSATPVQMRQATAAVHVAPGCTTTDMSGSPGYGYYVTAARPLLTDKARVDEAVHWCRDRRRGRSPPWSDREDLSAGSGLLAGSPQVDGALRAGFMAWNSVENLAFGVGVAILVLGTALVRRADRDRRPGAASAWLATVGCSPPGCHTQRSTSTSGTRPAACSPSNGSSSGGAILAIGALLYVMSGPASRAALGDNATADKSSVDSAPSPVTGRAVAQQ